MDDESFDQALIDSMNAPRFVPLTLRNGSYSLVPRGRLGLGYQGAIPEADSEPLECPSDEFTTDDDLMRMAMRAREVSTFDKHSCTKPGISDELFNSLKALKQAVHGNQMTKQMAGKFWNHVESFLIWIWSVSYARSYMQALPPTLAFLKNYADGSLLETVYASLAQRPTPEASDDETRDPSAFSSSSTAKACWDFMKGGPFADNMAFLLGTGSAIMACRVSNIEFSHPLVEKMSKHAAKTTVNAVDLIDASFSIFRWFSTVGLECFRKGDLSPIVYNHNMIIKIREIVSKWKARDAEICIGEFKYESEPTDLIRELNICVEMISQLTKIDKSPQTSMVINMYLTQCTDMLARVNAFLRTRGFKRAAFGIYVHGAPGVGKSTLNTKLAEACLLGWNIPYKKEECVSLNLSDQYQERVKNDTKTIIVEEMFPTARDKMNNADMAINLALNLAGTNQPWQPVMASLEKKDTVCPDHRVVIMNGNSTRPFLGIANSEGAMERRYLAVHVDNPKEFKNKDGSLNTKHAAFATEQFPPAAYSITFSRGVIDNNRFKRHVVEFTEESGETFKCKDMPLDVALHMLSKINKEHAARQENLYQEMMTQRDRVNCVKCLKLAEYCKCVEPTDVRTHELPKPKESGGLALSDDVTVDGPTTLKKNSRKFGIPRNHVPDAPEPEPLSDMSVSEPSIESEPEAGILTTLAIDASTTLVTSTYKAFGRYFWPANLYDRAFGIRKRVSLMADKMIQYEINKLADGTLWYLSKWVPNFIWNSPSFQCCLDFCIKSSAANDQIIMNAAENAERSLWAGFFSALWTLPLMIPNYLSLWKVCTVHSYEVVTPWFFGLFKQVETVPISWTEKFFNVAMNPLEHVFPWRIVLSLFVTSTMLHGVFYFAHRLMVSKIGYERRVSEIKKTLEERRSLQDAILQEGVEKETPDGRLATMGLIGGIIIAFSIYNISRRQPEAIDGDLTRDEKPGWMGYLNKITAPFNSVKGIPLYSEQEKHFIGNTFRTSIDIAGTGKKHTVQMFMPEPYIGIIPKHVLHHGLDLAQPMGDDIKFDLHPNGHLTDGTSGYISTPQAVQIEDEDLVMINVKNVAPVKNLTKFINRERNARGRLRCKLYQRDKNDNVQSVRVNARWGPFGHGSFQTEGYIYENNITGPGSCAAPLIAERNNPVIMGLHVAGATLPFSSNREGMACPLYKDAYDAAKAKLMSFKSSITSAEADTLPQERMGATVFTPGPAHPLAKVFHTDEIKNSSVKVHGRTPVRATPKSKYVSSAISDAVTQVFGVPNKWGPPNFKGIHRIYEKNVRLMADRPMDVHPDDLENAMQDFLEGVKPTVDKWLAKEKVQPLSEHDTVHGIEGKKFMNRIPMSTSIGPPLSGKKTNHATVNPDHEIEFNDYVLKEKAWMEDRLKNKKRCYPIYRAFAKDCATENTSDKVRLVYGGMTSFVLLIRQRYLPLLRMVQMNPVAFETAVGTNCFGPDWGVIMEYVEKFAADGLGFGLDYSKFDLRQPTNVMFAADKLFVELAKMCGYSKEDIEMMENGIVDMVNPYIEWNGTLISGLCMPSGIPVTVIKNSFVNALLLRSFFYYLKRTGVTIPGSFKDNVAITTYGDDVLGSVNPSIRRWFNFSAYKAYLKEIGMNITLPDKDADDCDITFLPMKGLDFLKRKSVYHPALGTSIGALEEESIFRNLHTARIGTIEVDGHVLPLDPEDLAIQSIGEVLTEWFNHGEEVYERRRQQILQLCELTSIAHPDVTLTYAQRVERWKEQYAESSPEDGCEDLGLELEQVRGLRLGTAL